MSVKVDRIQYSSCEENMPGGILAPITHMFGTSDLSTRVHRLNVQVEAATSHQKLFIQVVILSLSPKG